MLLTHAKAQHSSRVHSQQSGLLLATAEDKSLVCPAHRVLGDVKPVPGGQFYPAEGAQVHCTTLLAAFAWSGQKPA